MVFIHKTVFLGGGVCYVGQVDKPMMVPESVVGAGNPQANPPPRCVAFHLANHDTG